MIAKNSESSGYQNKINTVIGSITDANELLTQLQSFDNDLQPARLTQYLIDFTKQVMTTQAEYELINDAISQLKQ